MNDPTAPLVLIVDDEPMILALLKAALEQKKISTAAARDAREACDLFKAHRSSIKVLVSDVIMPETDGIQLAQCLLREQPALKILFISGYCSMYEGPLKGFECLTKPFNVNDVVSRVRRLLEEQRTVQVRSAV